MRCYLCPLAPAFLLLVSAVLSQGVLKAAHDLSPETEKRLQDLKLSYEGFLLKHATFPYEAAIKALNAVVLPALEREAASAAQRKDLDSLVRIKTDVERVKSGALLTETQELPPSSLKNIYATYELELGKIEAARKAKAADAVRRYDQGLKLVQDEMTMTQQVEVALAVKQLRDGLQPEYNAVSSLSSSNDGAIKQKGEGSMFGSDMPLNWTYHTSLEAAASGRLELLADGKAVFSGNTRNKNSGALEELKAEGSWQVGKKPGTLKLSFAKFPNEVWEVTLNGKTARLDGREVGTRYLKAVEELPASLDGPSSGSSLEDLVKSLGGSMTPGTGGLAFSFTGKRLTTAELLQLGAFKKIQAFDWNGGGGLDDAGMAAFEGMRDLYGLMLWSVGKFSDEGLRHLKNCRKLEYLNIGSNTGDFTGEGLKYLAGCSELRSLTLNFSAKLEGKNLRHLIGLEVLEELLVSHCKGIQDEHVDLLLQMPSLTRLALHGTSITNKGLLKLAALPNLQKLDAGAPGVTKEGIEALKQALPKATIGYINP